MSLYICKMSITIKNLSKIYNQQKALNGISLNIKKGEIVGLLGPNGAGKSTLMKIITCYVEPTSGKVIINNKNVNEDHEKIKSEIGYLSENNPLYTYMYVKEYLEFSAKMHNVSNVKKKIDEVILKTHINNEKNKKIIELSKGYKQRVGLAAALIHDPKILVLDEPTTGLDPNQLGDIRKLIKDIGANKTVLFSTHVLNEVEKICDRVIVINKGNIIEDKPIKYFHANSISLEKHFQKITT